MSPSDIAIIHAALSGNPDPEVMRARERVRTSLISPALRTALSACCDCSPSSHKSASETESGRPHCDGCCDPEDTDAGNLCNHAYRPSLPVAPPPQLTAEQRERIANTIAERFYLYDRFRETETFIPHDVAIAAIAEVCGKVEE